MVYHLTIASHQSLKTKNLIAMTQVRFNGRPAGRSFNNLMDDFFSSVPSLLREDFGAVKTSVPVNVRETENAYELEFAAPGFEKENFAVNLEKNILTVSAEAKTTEEKEGEKHLRREFRLQGFKRSFTVDENIDAEGISAKYVNGLLILNLPKKEAVKPTVKQISIL